MKTPLTMRLMTACIVSAAMMALNAMAAAPAVNPLLILRPLTPSDRTFYALPSTTEIASGMKTVPIGQPVYLDAEVNIAIAPTNIVSVAWALTNAPIGSAAVVTNSPLGTNVPIYYPSDALISQIAGRAMLRPDVRGQYTVVATITTTTNAVATTNVSTTNVTATITAGVYMGLQTCELCHSGGLIAKDIVKDYTNTLHASKFTRGINGQIAGYSSSCISCHTVGYDANTNAVNGGFDDIAKQLNWTFPTNLTSTNWTNMVAQYPSLANVANIQCENCHGPGSEHAYNLGDTNRISVMYEVGNCAVCHDATTHHIKVPEWKNSGHAISPRISGVGREACVRCHTAQGFKNYADGVPAVATDYTPIGCAACHDPHDPGNAHQLRLPFTYALGDGTIVTNGGFGAFCMNCHHTRNGPAASNIANYQLGIPTWDGGSSFGTHHSCQGDMLEGVNAITYGKTIPSSSHRYAITNTCVGCHMQASPAPTDPAFLHAGGHTWSMSYNTVTNGVTNKVAYANVCAQCHGPLTSYDMVREDYDGDGIIDGVQTEVQHLLNRLSTMLPGTNYVANGSYVANGLVKTSLSTKTNWPVKFLNAAYNWQFVMEDKSLGIHNTPFAVGLLRGSIADLTGDGNSDGLPDAWQITYFGSPTNALAAPNASASGDGIPNWLKYALGLDPRVAGLSVPGGVVWANGNTLINPPNNPGGTNAVQIFTAAEVAFNTQVGTSYQIQAISSLGQGWTNVGGPIAGTGNTLSYLTPTRLNVKQFYRVVHTP